MPIHQPNGYVKDKTKVEALIKVLLQEVQASLECVVQAAIKQVHTSNTYKDSF